MKPLLALLARVVRTEVRFARALLARWDQRPPPVVRETVVRPRIVIRPLRLKVEELDLNQEERAKAIERTRRWWADLETEALRSFQETEAEARGPETLPRLGEARRSPTTKKPTHRGRLSDERQTTARRGK